MCGDLRRSRFPSCHISDFPKEGRLHVSVCMFSSCCEDSLCMYKHTRTLSILMRRMHVQNAEQSLIWRPRGLQWLQSPQYCLHPEQHVQPDCHIGSHHCRWPRYGLGCCKQRVSAPQCRVGRVRSNQSYIVMFCMPWLG